MNAVDDLELLTVLPYEQITNRLESYVLERTKEINRTYQRSEKGSSSWDQIGLMAGLSGTALLNYYVGRSLNQKCLIDKGDQMVDHIINSLNSQSFKLSNTFSLCNGLTGVLFSLTTLEKRGFLAQSLEGLSDVEEFLFQKGLESMRINSVDYLHGGMGVLHYFLHKLPTIQNCEYIEQLIDAYQESAVIDQLGLRTKNISLKDREPNEYDLGMAHGTIGHMVILLQAYEKGFNKTRVRFLIGNALKFIEEKEIDKNSLEFRGVFPVSFIGNLPNDHSYNMDFYNSRLGWCYGDLNMCMLYLKLFKTFGSEEYLQKAIEIGEYSARRILKADTKISNVFFCHGSSGVAYMFKKIFDETQSQICLQASEFWYGHMMENTQKNINDFLKVEATRCLLNGLGGAVLSALARIQPDADDWNQIYLLN